MDNSLKTGFMAVFAVSGSVVFLAIHAHNRLFSNFMKKMEFEIKNSTGEKNSWTRRKKVELGSVKDEPIKKKVRFSDDMAESTAEIAYGKKDRSKSPVAASCRHNGENLEAMPQNWQVMYKGILQHKNIRGYN